MIIQKAKKSQDHKKESKRSTRNPKKGGPNIIPKLAIKKESPISSRSISVDDHFLIQRVIWIETGYSVREKQMDGGTTTNARKWSCINHSIATVSPMILRLGLFWMDEYLISH
jgi:hypothetical protein